MTNPYYNRVTDFVPDTSVRSSDLDSELNGVVAGFDLLSDPTKLGNGALMLGTDSGTADNYVYSNGGVSAILDGQIITFAPGNTSTGASVVSHNGGANTTIVRNDGSATEAGDLVAGVPVAMIYDEANDRWVLIGATAAQTLSDFRPGINAQVGTTYTVTASDEGKIVTCTNASAITVTLPSDSDEDLPIGFITHIHQEGAGQVTVAPAAGVTLRTALSLSTRVQYSSLSCIKIASDLYKVIGDMASS